MTVNGYIISQWQRCKRPWIIGRTHRLIKWRPQSLLSACLRHAIFNLSNGADLDKTTSIAVSNFLSSARNPGLDVVGIDTYTLAMDYCAVIRNVLEYLSRLTLLTLREMTPVSLSKDISWQFLSHIDDTGTLHRWKFVDYLNDDITDELHSWEVFGDIAAADAPMTLHLVSIGQRKGSRQHSPWCKIYAHPRVANIYRFQRKKGSKLEGDWKPTWFSDNPKNTPKEWVDMMLADNVLEGLIRHVSVKEVSPEHIELFEKDVLYESSMMLNAHKDKMKPRDLPLSRYACDHPYTCPHQFYCYNTNLTLDNVGIYNQRSKEEEAHEHVAAPR